MNVPGSNILSLALTAIRPQTLQWQAFVTRERNATGAWVSSYLDPVDIWGSMHPVNKKLYQTLGLDLAKNYQTLYTSADVRVTARDRRGDLVLFAGSTWECESDQNWAAVDGWRKILCVEVPPK